MRRAAVLVAVFVLAGYIPSARGQRAGDAGSRTIIVWGSESVPQRVERALDRIDGVRATSVRLGLDWLFKSRAAGGKVVDEPPSGFAFPLEVAVINTREYEHFSRAPDRDVVASLGRGEIALSESEMRLRGKRDVKRLRLRGRRVRVAGVSRTPPRRGTRA